MHEKSVAAAAKVYGDDSREFALALLEKAWVSARLDRSSDAPLRMVEQAKGILAARAPDTEDYAEALYMESHIVQATDTPRAVARGEEAVRLMERLHATDKRAAFARMELGAAYRIQGDLDGAVRTMSAALADYQRLFGADHHDVATLHNQIAVALFSSCGSPTPRHTFAARSPCRRNIRRSARHRPPSSGCSSRSCSPLRDATRRRTPRPTRSRRCAKAARPTSVCRSARCGPCAA